MSDFDALKARIRQHPAFGGGPADETYWLDLLEVTLAEIVPANLDALAEFLARVHERNPAIWPFYIAASHEDPFAWKVLQALFRRLQRREAGSLAVSEEQPPIFHAGFNALNDWARDVASEALTRPRRRGGDRRTNMSRDAAIVAAVNGIRETSGIPYEHDTRKEGNPRTACHVVAERLGWEYGKVRTIWRRNRSLLDRARDQGLLPPARKRTRRR